MDSEADGTLGRSRDELKECAAILQRIVETCCMPERSGPMAEAAGEIRRALDILEGGLSEREALSAGLESIARCGGRIGELYVTCCTETREPLYRRILEVLNRAHGIVGEVIRQ